MATISYDTLDEIAAKHAQRMQETYENRTAGDSTWHGHILLFLMDLGNTNVSDELVDKVAGEMERAYFNYTAAGDVTWYGLLFHLLYEMKALPTQS